MDFHIPKPNVLNNKSSELGKSSFKGTEVLLVSLCLFVVLDRDTAAATSVAGIHALSSP